jgi:hypothetical protein
VVGWGGGAGAGARRAQTNELVVDIHLYIYRRKVRQMTKKLSYVDGYYKASTKDPFRCFSPIDLLIEFRNMQKRK